MTFYSSIVFIASSKSLRWRDVRTLSSTSPSELMISFAIRPSAKSLGCCVEAAAKASVVLRLLSSSELSVDNDGEVISRCTHVEVVRELPLSS